MLQKLYSRFLLLFVFLTLGATLVQAAEPSFLRESIRARGMGHAFTAVANDEMVLYYNPAALRSVQYNPFKRIILNRPQGCGVVIKHHFIISDCGKSMAHSAGSNAFAQKGRFSSLYQGCTEREENKKKEEPGI